MDKHDDETVERVAEAIWNANPQVLSGTASDGTRYDLRIWAAIPEGWSVKDRVRKSARAALSAIPARDDALEGLRELSERATRGPWRTNSMTTFGEDWPIGTVMDCGTADEKHRSLVTTDGVRASALGESSAETDAALIAAAVNYVRAKLAAPAQRDEGWMPIETAPKDGVPYIARWAPGHHLHGLALMCQFSVTMDTIVSRAGIDHDGKIIVLEMARENWPTHWRHLPAPPAPAQEPR